VEVTILADWYFQERRIVQPIGGGGGMMREVVGEIEYVREVA